MIKNEPDKTLQLIGEGQLRHCHTCGCMHLHLPSIHATWKLCPLGHETVACHFTIGAEGLKLGET